MSRTSTAPALVALVALLALLAGCSNTAPSPETAAPPEAAAPPAPDAAPPAPVPGEPGEPADPRLTPPSGQQQTLVMTVARGSQVYECEQGEWTLREPVAVLDAPETAALHDRGPRWLATVDGSSVGATQAASVDVPGTIPHLLLRVTDQQGEGVFGQVEYIQRVATTGGVAPEGACADGQVEPVPYGAEYRFFAPAG